MPDLEAWLHATPDRSLSHFEANETAQLVPLSTCVACPPHAPLIDTKLLRLVETGNDPHFSFKNLMSAVRISDRDHILDIEF